MDENNNIDTENIEVVEGDEELKFESYTSGLRKIKKRKATGMAALVMKLSHGYIKNETQANIVLIILAIIIFAVSLSYFF